MFKLRSHLLSSLSPPLPFPPSPFYCYYCPNCPEGEDSSWPAPSGLRRGWAQLGAAAAVAGSQILSLCQLPLGVSPPIGEQIWGGKTHLPSAVSATAPGSAQAPRRLADVALQLFSLLRQWQQQVEGWKRW